jgi:hypothetical protein
VVQPGQASEAARPGVGFPVSYRTMAWPGIAIIVSLYYYERTGIKKIKGVLI